MKSFQKLLAVGISAVLLSVGVLACQSAARTEKVSALSTTNISKENVIVTQGKAVISGKAETASLSVGVSTQNEKAALASDENAEKMNAVIAALKKSGIKEEAMSTSYFNISPEYDYSSNPARFTGYLVNNQITVKLDDVDKVAAILDLTIGAGANSVNRVSFGMKDGKSQYDQALEAAVADARAKAELLAKAADIKGKLIVLSIAEQSSYDTPYAKGRDMAAMESTAATPILPAEQDVTATVEVVFGYN